ncbi:MAG: hypothetical protein C0518_16145 [Opitutus sp.]|nr:hypothetical protein [Opitutus sp.]
MSHLIRPAAWAGLLLCFGLTAGCNSTKTATAEKPRAAKDEYTQVNSMGSWIPRKVKKQADLIGDGTQTVDGSALEKVQQAGHSRVPRDAGR